MTDPTPMYATLMRNRFDAVPWSSTIRVPPDRIARWTLPLRTKVRGVMVKYGDQPSQWIDFGESKTFVEGTPLAVPIAEVVPEANETIEP